MRAKEIRTAEGYVYLRTRLDEDRRKELHAAWVLRRELRHYLDKLFAPIEAVFAKLFCLDT